MKIAIYGIGGVGGYYAGKLAKKYANSDKVEIYLIARGENLKSINDNGLRIVDVANEFVAFPKMAVENPHEIGKMDYVILAIKSYDLTTAIENIKPCIGTKTVILPLLNGGNITETIRNTLPESIVWSGCTYIVSRKISAGTIQNFGNNSKIFFGYDKGNYQQVFEFEKVLKQADIDIKATKNVRNSIWKKFFFISVTASLTSYFDCTFSELVKEDKIKFVRSFGAEFLSVAEAEKINIAENPIELLIQNTCKLPAGTTSSMYSDFQVKHKSEVDSLTGTIVDLARKHNLSTPLYHEVYRELKERERKNQAN